MVDYKASGPGGDIPYPMSLQAAVKRMNSQGLENGVFLGLAPPPPSPILQPAGTGWWPGTEALSVVLTAQAAPS